MPEKESCSSYKKEFEENALKHLTFIYRLAYRMTGNRQDAEDLSQETFKVAFEKYYQLRDRGKCKSWLTVILKNLYFKQLKKRGNIIIIDLDKVSPYISSSKDYNVEAAKGIVKRELQVLLDRLNDKYKVPLILFYIGDFSYKEIARIMKIPIGTVMSRIARGKQYLRKEIGASVK